MAGAFVVAGGQGPVRARPVAAAVVLSTAAAAGDREYKPPAEAMRQVENRIVRFAAVSAPEVQKTLRTARSLCTDL
ncbi:hypothetical protein RKD49_007876 [Streptomyces glaucescens]